jgi:osmotically-inducible protein OsmY
MIAGARTATIRTTVLLSLVTTCLIGMSGCVGLAAAGAAAGVASMTDRRTLGAQTDDESIELRGRSRIRAEQGAPEEVSITSYNRRVLLTGRVPDEEGKVRAEKIVGQLPNVRLVHNELVVGSLDTVSGANDTLITTRVKAALVGERNAPASAVKVVTENTIVYLMGLVTEKEGNAAATAAAAVSGVSKVVTLFEYATEEEIQRLRQGGAPAKTN